VNTLHELLQEFAVDVNNLFWGRLIDKYLYVDLNYEISKFREKLRQEGEIAPLIIYTVNQFGGGIHFVAQPDPNDPLYDELVAYLEGEARRA
jgi:hypothetical protein